MSQSLINNQRRKRKKTLSKRELEILSLLSNGLRKQTISEQLGISHSTVATHAKNIYQKLGVINAAGAVGKAYRDGILSLD